MNNQAEAGPSQPRRAASQNIVKAKPKRAAFPAALRTQHTAAPLHAHDPYFGARWDEPSLSAALKRLAEVPADARVRAGTPADSSQAAGNAPTEEEQQDRKSKKARRKSKARRTDADDTDDTDDDASKGQNALGIRTRELERPYFYRRVDERLPELLPENSLMRAVEHRAHQLFQARKLMFEEPADPHEDPAAEGASSVNGAEASPRGKPSVSKKEKDSTKEAKQAADPEKLKKRRYAQKQRLLRQARIAALPPAQQRRLHEAQRGESACYASISRVDKRIVKLEAQLREVRESTALLTAAVPAGRAGSMGSLDGDGDGDEASTQGETRREALESQLSDLQRAREGHRAEAEQARKDIQQILSAVDENDPAVQEAYRRALADEGEGGAATHKFEIIDDGKDDGSSRAASGPRTMSRRFDHSGLVAMSIFLEEYLQALLAPENLSDADLAECFAAQPPLPSAAEMLVSLRGNT